MPTLTLALFGAPTITLEQQPVHIGRRKAVALLAYLAVTQRRQSRAHLADLLWPDYDESGARGELRRALSTLNRALGASWLAADREGVAFIEAGELEIDVLTFRRRLTTARAAPLDHRDALRDAVELAQADLLAGFLLDDAPGFEEWHRFEAGALRRDLAWALEQLTQPAGPEEWASALAFAHRWLALDPLDEAAHRRLMELHAATGDLSAAYRQYQACKQLLATELDAPPTTATTALYEQIRAGNYPIALTTTAIKQSAPPTTHPSPAATQPDLPAQLTPFIGRAHELNELTTLLADGQQRLITVIGPGGIGKTRLALQLAHQQVVATHWRDGVHFVDLSAVERGGLLTATLAEGLGAPLAGGQALLAQLVDYLRPKQMLIVCDNLEQLLTAADISVVATLFDELLLHAPAVALLVTSRARLNLHGETVFNLLAMPFPATINRTGDTAIDGGAGAANNNDLDPTLASYDAIRLFCRSAQRADRTFELTAANQHAVLRICQLVQGMPLAIDLAAAWVRLLPCEEIAAELSRNIELLTATAQNMPARHRSIAAVFDHSWRFLSSDEQRAFTRLACFRGGCTRDAAQQIADASLPVLSMLVDKSLLRRTPEGRFVIHELLRQFAAEKLAEGAALATVATRHSTYYLALLAHWEGAFLTHERMRAFRTLQHELDNLRHAWEWAVQQQLIGSLAQGLQTFYTLYLEIINGFEEGIDRFGQAIAMTDRVSAQGNEDERAAAQHLQARLQARSAQLHLFTGKIEEAAALFAQSLTSLRAVADQAEVAFVLTRLAMTRLWQGELAIARTLIEEALAISRQGEFPGARQAALTNYGYIAQQAGEFALAETLNRECLELLRASGDPDGLASTLGNLGLNYVFQEQYEAALPYLEEALRISKQIGNRSRIAIALTNLMDVYMKVGRLAEARVNGVEALATFTDLGQRQYAAILESSLGYLTLAEAEATEPADTRLTAAQSHFRRALAIAQEIDVDLIRVYGITGFGELLARRGEHERAVALLSLAAAFPTTDPDIKGRAEARLQALATLLPVSRFQSAQNEGHELALATVAMELLAEFADLRAGAPCTR